MEMIKSIKEAATRPDFIALMDTGMKTSAMDVYGKVESEYEQVVSIEDSTKDKETYPGLSGLGDPEKVLEGEAFKENSNFSLQSLDITNYKYGRIVAITREMVDDDQTKKVAQLPNTLAVPMKNYENKIVFTQIVGGETAATCYDGLAIFTTNHYNRSGGATNTRNDNLYTNASMSAGSINTGLNRIALWRGLNDEEITVTPLLILCPFYLGFTANWLVSGTGLPAYAAGVLGAASNQAQLVGQSPLRVVLKVVVSKWITKLGGATNDWYIGTNVPGWKFQWRDKFEIYAESNLSTSWFERDVMRWKSRERFGFKCIDWRGMLKVT